MSAWRVPVRLALRDALRHRTRSLLIVLPGGDGYQDILTRVPSIARARRLLGWEPKVPLEQGLKRTIEYFRSVVS